MTTYIFSSRIGQRFAFDPTQDILSFSGYSAANLTFVQQGSDLVVGNNGQTVTLANVLFSSLTDGNLSFSGSVAHLGTSGNDPAP
ncbi:hypothetical protein, partial [Methylobacterium nonmethylotrophicum]